MKSIRFPVTITVYLDIIEGDLVRFGRYATIWHKPSGETYSEADLPEPIRDFFCVKDDLSREYLERELQATEHTDDPKILVLTKSFGPDGREPKPGLYCDSLGTRKIDLKWACWSRWEGYWSDFAPEVYAEMAGLKPGQEITVKSFPRKECRGMEVTVRRLYPSMWTAVGAVWSCWDETCDLLCNLNLLSTDDSECEEFLKAATGPDGEIDYEQVNALVIKAGYSGFTDFDAFNESVPYSHYTWEPGIDVEFNVKANTFAKLMHRIDNAEAELLIEDQKEWSYFEKMYTNNHKET